MQQENSEGQKMETSRSFRQTFVVAGQASETSNPANRTLNDPPFGQQDEITLGLRQFDNLKLDALLGSCLSRRFTCLPRIGKGDLDVIVGDVLDLFHQRCYLFSVGRIGGGDIQCQQVAQRIDCQMHLASLPFLGTVEPGPAGTVRLSIITALGSAFRPSVNRNSVRRSSTMASNTPAAIQRLVC